MHVVDTADGPVTPVGIEQRVEAVPGVGAAAVVGVGPVGTQALVVVVVPEVGSRALGGRLRFRVARRRLRPAAYELAERVRRAAGVPVAAVLTADRLPLDIRHASKVDRAEVARRAALTLAGRGSA